MSMKINKLEIENVKRVKAVKLEPTANGLTIIGGKNNQGKTSVLDAIAWGLGGNRFRPTDPQRDDSVVPPSLSITMSNGLVVERKGKNSDLKVIDPEGNRAGQNLLDSFVEELALNLPKFMQQSSKEKAQTLLQIIGVGDQLALLERQETEIYNQRHAIGQIADQKQKFANEQPYFPDAPKELVSASELIKQQQSILALNGENQRKRNQLNQLTTDKHRIHDELSRLDEQIKQLQERKESLLDLYNRTVKDEEIAMKTAQQLHDESTAKIEESINDIEKINIKVRANLNKDKAEDDAKEYREQYDTLTSQLDTVRQKKIDLLKNADLPLPGLSVEDGELIYLGKKWDCMSGSDQLKVATAIVRKLKPQCGFVLLDKLEQMDLDTLHEFGQWLDSEGLQAIATRVSTGDECSIIIEDGYSSNLTIKQPQQNNTSKWKAGEF